MILFCSWSGGKESALALHRALKIGEEVTHLLTMVNTTGRRSRSHGLPVGLIAAQAERLDLDLVQRRASWRSYEQEYKRTLRALKKQGVVGGIFGDIDLAEHRQWVERVCRETGMEAWLPLWREAREALLKEFMEEGFRAVIVAVHSPRIGEEWVGRELDGSFLKAVKEIEGVDICGEFGEYHTFVYDGPIFKQPVPFEPGKRMKRGEHCFLQLRGGGL